MKIDLTEEEVFYIWSSLSHYDFDYDFSTNTRKELLKRFDTLYKQTNQEHGHGREETLD